MAPASPPALSELRRIAPKGHDVVWPEAMINSLGIAPTTEGSEASLKPFGLPFHSLTLSLAKVGRSGKTAKTLTADCDPDPFPPLNLNEKPLLPI